MDPSIGLVLSGGGARAAYQVGALRAIAEVVGRDTPFDILVGSSAGAINATALAANAEDFRSAVARLEAIWRGLTPDRVYRTDPASLAGIGGRWLRQLVGGGLCGPPDINALLDTSPLRALLTRELAIPRIAEQVAAGRLRGVAVTATSYQTGMATTFFDAAPEVQPWTRTGRRGLRAPIAVSHVLASSAIPLFFPPVEIDGSAFGDGCVRLTAPLSPAIRIGADRLLAIGVRYRRDGTEPAPPGPPGPPSPAEVGGLILNALFLDSLETDTERLERINGTLSLMTPAQRHQLAQPLRPIRFLMLRPSADLGRLAMDGYHELPLALRHLLRGIGADHQRGWDLLSYLAFDPDYIAPLIELGYVDTRSRRAEVAAFFA